MQILQPPSFANSRQAADAFQRQLKERQQAAVQDGQTRTDPADLPFRVVMEFKRAPVAQAARELAPSGFTAGPVEYDCSHEFSGGSGAYTRVSNAMTTIAGGGLQQIADALDRLKAMGATVGRTCAMRIYYPNTLSPQETRNLINIQSAHEDLLYRVARSGASGRSRRHKHSYARKLTSRLPAFGFHHSSPGRVAREGTWGSLAQKYLGMNTFTGQLEFRYLDASLNAPAVGATVALLLGMIAAAKDGRLQEPGDRPRAFITRICTRSPRWNRLIQETVGKGPIEEQLKRQF